MTLFHKRCQRPGSPSPSSVLFAVCTALGSISRRSVCRAVAAFTAANCARSTEFRPSSSTVKKWLTRGSSFNDSSSHISVVLAARSQRTCQYFEPAAIPIWKIDTEKPTTQTAKVITGAALPPDCATPAISTPWKIMKKLFRCVSCEISNSRCRSANSNALPSSPTGESFP